MRNDSLLLSIASLLQFVRCATSYYDRMSTPFAFYFELFSIHFLLSGGLWDNPGKDEWQKQQMHKWFEIV